MPLFLVIKFKLSIITSTRTLRKMYSQLCFCNRTYHTKTHWNLQSQATITATTSSESKQTNKPTEAKTKSNRTENGDRAISRERCGDSEIRQNAPSAQRRLSRNDIETRPEDWIVQHSLGGRMWWGQWLGQGHHAKGAKSLKPAALPSWPTIPPTIKRAQKSINTNPPPAFHS